MADLNDPTKNVTIWNNAKSKNVSTITDGAIERLAVDANATIVDNESPTRYQLKSDFDATGVTLNTSTDDVLFSYVGDGVIDFIAVAGSTASYEVTIEIDSVERIRITMAELASIGLSNATNVDMWAETANKNFRYSPEQVGFTTGFRVLAKATGTPLALVKHLVLYRERT